MSGLQKDIITIMCGRLQYYCLVQIISRIGATWYQLQYGFRETIDRSSSNFQTSVFAVQFMLTPSAGIGYLIVFLAMQPEAYHHFKQLLKRYNLYFECCHFFEDGFEFCGWCWCTRPPPRRKRKRISRMSENSVSSTMEQRILEDIRESELTNSKDDEPAHLSGYRDTDIEGSDGICSLSSSYFVGDDHDLAEELERLYRVGSARIAHTQ